MPINQSFCYPMLHDDALGVDGLCAAVAEIGYAALETWGRAGCPFDEILAGAAKHGLRVASFASAGGLVDPAQHEQIEKTIKEDVAIAADNNIPGIIVLSGNLAGLDKWTALRNCAEGLKRVAPYAEEKGINLNLELLNSKVDHKDYACDRTLWAVTCCDLVKSPRVKILYDIYHMAIMEGDLIRTIGQFGSYFGHYHTAGNPGRKDMDETQEIYYPAVMKAILDSGYDLFVGHEFSPKSGNAVQALKAAYATCNV